MKEIKIAILTIFSLVATIVSLLLIQQVSAYYREVEYVSGHLAVDEGDAYGPYSYGVT